MASQPRSRIASNIGANIRALRKERGLLQHELAALIDTQHFMVSRWERGAHHPSDEYVAALATALKVDVADLYAAKPKRGKATA